jgi:1-acyl-sn-glycerol-3-phosphate acyltransferase
VRLLVRALVRLRVSGLEHIPGPPFIIASNHQAWYDTAFILAALHRASMVYTMARRDTVFNRAWKRWLMPRLGVFPIAPSRGELDHRAVATVYQVLSRGGVVLVFPEGRYSRGRALRPLRKGVAHFALEAGVPICPIALTGVDRLRPFGVVGVSIGPPVRPDPPAWWTVQRRVERVLDGVRRAILQGFDRGQPGGRGLRTRVAGAARRTGRALRRSPSRLRARIARLGRSSKEDTALDTP